MRMHRPHRQGLVDNAPVILCLGPSGVRRGGFKSIVVVLQLLHNIRQQYTLRRDIPRSEQHNNVARRSAWFVYMAYYYQQLIVMVD